MGRGQLGSRVLAGGVLGRWHCRSLKQQRSGVGEIGEQPVAEGDWGSVRGTYARRGWGCGVDWGSCPLGLMVGVVS